MIDPIGYVSEGAGCMTRVNPRCAHCGRRLGPRTSACFYNLYAPAGRRMVVGWHDACVRRDPAYRGNWVDRQNHDVWRAMLETIRRRNPNRVGPGDAYARECAA